MEIEVPSPNVFLRQPPLPSERGPAPLKKSAKPRAHAPSRSSTHLETTTRDASTQNNANSGVKQSKSRGGCMTCKKKRVKCDEAKPTCGQCEKRNVECDGYKIHYKWRFFDDTTPKQPRVGKPKKQQNATAQGDATAYEYVQLVAQPTSFYLEEELSWSPGLQNVCTYATQGSTECLPPAGEDDLINPSEQLNSSQFDTLPDLEPGFRDSDVEQFDEESNPTWTFSFATETSNPHWRVRAPSPASSQNSSNSSQPTHLTPFNALHLDPSSPEMLLLRFDKETCGILSIKDGSCENPWRTFIWPLAKDSDALYHAISAMAAFHGATTQPRLRLTGMTHMTKSISKLSTDMHKMSWNQILASTLALCLSEGWDDKISTGIQHLKGAKTVLNNALARRSRNIKLGQLTREEAEPLKFLSNTFVYLDAIARLTSSEDHDNIDLDHTVKAVNEPVDSEIDPLMGCATTLFPLLGKVGSLIQRVRRTSTNSLSIISEANELREQLLHWEPPDIYSFEQPQDPSSNVRHVLHTAEAYRRATLLHLHSAITELSSEPSFDQAKGTLAMLAATPLSSRTMIVQIFPLLVGSCEMVQPDDRQWVAQRWDAMMKRLTIVSVFSCWKVVKEVWRRRDQWVATQAQQVPRSINRNMSPGSFFLGEKNRNIPRTDPSTEDPFSDNFLEGDNTTHDSSGRPRARNPNFDAPRNQVTRRNFVQLPRRHTDVSLLSGGIEYSVRGQLHWLGVMSDWNWEVFL